MEKSINHINNAATSTIRGRYAGVNTGVHAGTHNVDSLLNANKQSLLAHTSYIREKEREGVPMVQGEHQIKSSNLFRNHE